jgi:uncharacterized protein YrrD
MYRFIKHNLDTIHIEMLILSQDYYNKPILSLRTGGEIGTSIAPIVNPNTLKIEGWYAVARGEREEFILPINEVREFINKGYIVDDHSALALAEDMVRLKEIVALRFDLIDKSVITESGSKLGKIVDYAVDNQSQYIKKLYVNPPFLKGLTSGQLLIDRSSIIEITNTKIVVSDATIKDRSGLTAGAAA